MSEVETNKEHAVHNVVLDLQSQAHLAQINKKLEKKIFDLLTDAAKIDMQTSMHRGALIVLGEFVRYDYKIPGMRQFKSNPIEGSALFLADKGIGTKLKDLFDQDGAILIDATGQILAARVYLQVDNASVAVDEECSTRHLSAASFSQSPHIVACFTLSEETGKVRHYVGGKCEDVYDPQEKIFEDENSEATEN